MLLGIDRKKNRYINIRKSLFYLFVIFIPPLNYATAFTAIF